MCIPTPLDSELEAVNDGVALALSVSLPDALPDALVVAVCDGERVLVAVRDSEALDVSLAVIVALLDAVGEGCGVTESDTLHETLAVDDAVPDIDTDDDWDWAGDGVDVGVRVALVDELTLLVFDAVVLAVDELLSLAVVMEDELELDENEPVSLLDNVGVTEDVTVADCEGSGLLVAVWLTVGSTWAMRSEHAMFPSVADAKTARGIAHLSE
jgi:hypothetical protein